MKICPVGAQLFYAGRQTKRQSDMTQLTFDFRNFANASKNQTETPKSDVTNNNARLCAFFQPTAEDKPNFTANSPCRAVWRYFHPDPRTDDNTSIDVPECRG